MYISKKLDKKLKFRDVKEVDVWSKKLKSVWCRCFNRKVNLSRLDKNDWGLGQDCGKHKGNNEWRGFTGKERKVQQGKSFLTVFVNKEVSSEMEVMVGR